LKDNESSNALSKRGLTEHLFDLVFSILFESDAAAAVDAEKLAGDAAGVS
jgi:hypothetical protein